MSWAQHVAPQSVNAQNFELVSLGTSLYHWFTVTDSAGSANDGSSPVVTISYGGGEAATPILTLTDIPGVGGSVVRLTDTGFPDGCYQVNVVVSADNGFEAGKWYAIFATINTDSQTPGELIGTFRT